MRLKRIATACMFALAMSALGTSAQQAKPQYGAWGYDIAGADRAIKPGDDFFRYANGGWMDATPIPPDRSSYGGFSILDELKKRAEQYLAMVPSVRLAT